MSIQITAQEQERLPNDTVCLETGNNIHHGTLLAALAKACHFPAYFGHNLDAAWDCLSDHHNVTHLLLRIAPTAVVNECELQQFIALLDDAYHTYQSPQLWIIDQR